MNTPAGPVNLLIEYAQHHFNLPLACGHVVICTPARYLSLMSVRFTYKPSCQFHSSPERFVCQLQTARFSRKVFLTGPTVWNRDGPTRLGLPVSDDVWDSAIFSMPQTFGVAHFWGRCCYGWLNSLPWMLCTDEFMMKNSKCQKY